jgi:hypothetical protein
MEHKNQVSTPLTQADRTSYNDRGLLTDYHSPRYSVSRREQGVTSGLSKVKQQKTKVAWQAEHH